MRNSSALLPTTAATAVGRWAVRVALLLLLTGLVSACSLLNRDSRLYGDQEALTGTAYLVCSEGCADRAQCGDSPEKGRVVLLSTRGPAGQQHDLSLTENAAVTIVEARDEGISLVQGGAPAVARFYLVNTLDRGAGWVAGWCVSNQPNP